MMWKEEIAKWICTNHILCANCRKMIHRHFFKIKNKKEGPKLFKNKIGELIS